jgi:hypothetical protein
MKPVQFLCCAVAATSIVGCQGAGFSPPAAANLSQAPSHRSASWISPAKSADDVWTIDTNVYGYSFTGKQVEELQGFTEPVGLCSDPSSDLYVVDAGVEKIWAFKPGQSKPYFAYYDLFNTPNACAFDPTTGNLAVANSTNVEIFPPDSGSPLMYTTSQFTSYSFVDYDTSGNLYVDGSGSSSNLQLAELLKGGSTLTNITVSGLGSGTDAAGGLVWDGHDLAVADGASDVIYRISLSGSSGKIIDTWHIAGWTTHYAAGFAVDKTQLLFPESGKVEFFTYPPKSHAKKSFTANAGDVLTVTPELIY